MAVNKGDTFRVIRLSDRKVYLETNNLNDAKRKCVEIGVTSGERIWVIDQHDDAYRHSRGNDVLDF